MNEQTISVRLSSAQRAKVESLAARTRRTESDLLRLLIDGAELAAVPDVRAPLVRAREANAPAAA